VTGFRHKPVSNEQLLTMFEQHQVRTSWDPLDEPPGALHATHVRAA